MTEQVSLGKRSSFHIIDSPTSLKNEDQNRTSQARSSSILTHKESAESGLAIQEDNVQSSALAIPQNYSKHRLFKYFNIANNT